MTILPGPPPAERMVCRRARVEAPGDVTLTGKPHEERHSRPLVNSVSDYSR
jgi:hypothetical protein